MLFSQSALEAKLNLPEEPQPHNATLVSVSSPAQDMTPALVATYSSSLEAPDALQAPAPATAETPAPAQSHPLTDAEKKQASEAELQKELHQRMGGVVPNFNAVLDGSNVPLSPGQKMRASFRSAIDPYQFGLALISSGIGQGEDSHHNYGQGAQGYGKRLGANFTDQFDGTILGNGVFPVLLKQDARYFRKGEGSFIDRFIYSVGTTVRCKGDNGKWQPNYSNLLGNIAAGGISNLYYPSNERGFKLTIEQGFEVTAEGSIGALLIEFYPDIRKHIHGKKVPN